MLAASIVIATRVRSGCAASNAISPSKRPNWPRTFATIMWRAENPMCE